MELTDQVIDLICKRISKGVPKTHWYEDICSKHEFSSWLQTSWESLGKSELTDKERLCLELYKRVKVAQDAYQKKVIGIIDELPETQINLEF